jgi:hypothetical protein
LQIGPELYTNLPDKNSTLAIGPLAREAARLRPIPGEPAALPVGQVARLGQGAHLGATVTGVGAEQRPARGVSYGPLWAHYLGGYQDRLLSGPLGLPGLRYTASEGVEHKDYTGVVLG